MSQLNEGLTPTRTARVKFMNNSFKIKSSQDKLDLELITIKGFLLRCSHSVSGYEARMRNWTTLVHRRCLAENRHEARAADNRMNNESEEEVVDDTDSGEEVEDDNSEMGDEEVSEAENIINESESEEDVENNIDDNMVYNDVVDVDEPESDEVMDDLDSEREDEIETETENVQNVESDADISMNRSNERQLLEEPDEEISTEMCMICHVPGTSAEKYIVVPCGHSWLCRDCKLRSSNYCPYCRGDITMFVRLRATTL